MKIECVGKTNELQSESESKFNSLNIKDWNRVKRLSKLSKRIIVYYNPSFDKIKLMSNRNAKNNF